MFIILQLCIVRSKTAYLQYNSVHDNAFSGNLFSFLQNVRFTCGLVSIIVIWICDYLTKLSLM